MKSQYYVSKNGEPRGPYTPEQIFEKVKAQEHSWIDYVYDESQAQWVLLIEHPIFSQKYNELNSISMRGKVRHVNAEDNLKDKEWYVLKEGKNYGPFSFVDLVQMLQSKTLFEYDYVWNQKINAWKTVSEVPDFHPDKIKTLRDSGQNEITEVFFRRRHVRANFGCSLIVHNNKSVFKGKTFEISQGGAGITIDDADFLPGQTLYLHFKPSDNVPAFNTICQIVSKKVNKTKTGVQFKYGVKFVSVSASVKEKIREYTETKKAA